MWATATRKKYTKYGPDSRQSTRKEHNALHQLRRTDHDREGMFHQQCYTIFGRSGITIGDKVFIDPKVNLITINHAPDLENRNTTYSRPIVIKDKAWIDINSTILP